MSTETGIRIRKMREFRNYTQTYVAEKLNLSQNAYSKIENGVIPITSDRLEEIAKTLDVPVESILNSEQKIFNIDNNQINQFYIENLHSENKDTMQQTIDLLKEQVDYLKGQNTTLLKTIDTMSKK